MKKNINYCKVIPVIAEVDVLVVGAGMAGCTAAIAAAREGSRTMLVDRFGYPGGNLGPGNIAGAPGFELPPFIKELGGIPGEFISRCNDYVEDEMFHSYFRDSNIMTYIWIKMLNENNVEMMFNTFVGDTIMEGNKITGVIITNKSGTQAIKAKVVIDSTGDADVAAFTGAPIHEGETKTDKEQQQPGLYFGIGNVDLDVYHGQVYGKECSEEDMKWAKETLGAFGTAIYYVHHSKLLGYIRKAWENGDFKLVRQIEDLGYILNDHSLFKGSSGVQVVEDPVLIGRYGVVGGLIGARGLQSYKSGDSKIMNKLEICGREYIFELSQFFKKYVPGFENSYLHFVAPYFSSRAGRSIISEHPVTSVEVDNKAKFDDTVFVAGIGKVVDKKLDVIGAYGPFDFPYRQLLPKKIEGLLAAGRAAIIQPPVMRVRWMVFTMGQVAGVAAALAIKGDTTPRNINVKELQKILVNNYNIYLGDDERLRELGIK